LEKKTNKKQYNCITVWLILPVTLERALNFQIFFIYNNYNNHIINNKSDKRKILNLRMAARHWQWHGANTSLSMMSLLKRATGSGAFVSYK
jgi:hypothetical protein